MSLRFCHQQDGTRPLINRAPDTHPNDVPKSRTVFRPGKRQPAMNVQTQWSPWTGVVPREVYFGSHDGLQGRMMAVEQADMYDPTANAWPNNGQFDHPTKTGLVGITPRIPPHTSAHRGFANPVDGAKPTMLFHAPPVFSYQTKPILAVGV